MFLEEVDMLITVGEVCEYDVVTVSPETSVREAAQLMSERNIGALVVVDDVEEKSSLRGMLTDRDIVMRLLAEGVDVENTTVSDAMTTEVEAVNEGQTVQYALQCMQDK